MRTQRTDSGSYNYPAVIKKTGTRVDDGMGGDTAGLVVVRGGSTPPLMVNFGAKTTGGIVYKVMQLYPEATHWATMRYASDAVISPGMFLFVTIHSIDRMYEILRAEDMTLEHVTTALVLIEHNAKGSV